jgi:hypothetical protein
MELALLVGHRSSDPVKFRNFSWVGWPTGSGPSHCVASMPSQFLHVARACSQLITMLTPHSLPLSRHSFLPVFLPEPSGDRRRAATTTEQTTETECHFLIPQSHSTALSLSKSMTSPCNGFCPR